MSVNQSPENTGGSDPRTAALRILVLDQDPAMQAIYADVLSAGFAEAAGRPVDLCAAKTTERARAEVLDSLERGDRFAVAFVGMDCGEGCDPLALPEWLRAQDGQIEIVLLSMAEAVSLDEVNRRVGPPRKVLYLEKPVRTLELRQIALSLCAKWEAELELEDLNRNLTHKVDERTEELNAANLRLMRDIARRAAVLRELKASEQRYRMLFDKDITANFVADGDGLVMDCNTSFAVMAGFETPQDVHGMEIHRIWEQLGGPEMLEDILKRSDRLVSKNMEFKRNGRSFYYLVSLDTVHDPDGYMTELRGYFFDVTDFKTLEEQLRMAQKMEALGTLAGGIAHDFNNILGVILGYSEIIENSAEPGSGLERRIKEISHAGKRARDLVTQILNFSRQGPQERQALTLSPLIKEALKLLRSSVPSNVEIVTRIETENDSVQADPTQMHQIMLNLCGNAAHAMGEKGGIITVSLADVADDDPIVPPLDYGIPERFVRLTVRDSGSGMDPEVQARIFEPFFTTKKQGEGTGMGLAMVHGIVKRHEGYIHVESEKGEGTAFHIFLPRASELPEQDRAAPHDMSCVEGRVLFVDDEKPLADIGRDMLQECGFDVVTRTSSVEALEAFRHRAEDFDLVVTDQTMPNMTGLELAREILKVRSDIPIILCTGFADGVSYDRLRDIGISDYIMKPILKHDLMASISRLLGEH